METRPIPRWFQWLFGAFMVVYVPAYWAGYGWMNFLWTSNVILIMSFLATIFQWRFVASMAAVGGLVAEVIWSLDFIVTAAAVVFGWEIRGFTEYVFRPGLPVWLRMISAFHLALPPLLIWLIYRLGYDRRAWVVQILFMWVLIAVTWLVTPPLLNINLVFSYQKYTWLQFGVATYLIVGSLAIGAIIALTHFILLAFFRERS